jgi:hypothetical protein
MRSSDRAWRAAVAVLVLLLLAGEVPGGAAPPGTTLIYPPWSHCYGMHRVNQTHLTLRAGFKYKFDDPQGVAALKLAAEDDTMSTHDDDELTVFGVNSGQNLLIFNTSITSIAFYGSGGRGPGEFNHPTAVAADRAGHVVVSDTGNDRLHVLQYENDHLHHVRFIEGSFDGERLLGPTGVAVEGGEIYALDPVPGRILVFDLQGGLLRVLRPMRDGRPLLQDPFSIAVIRRDDDNNFFAEDFIAVSDSSHARLWKLDRRGEPFATHRIQEVQQGGREFYFVAIDYYANVYCSDRSGRIHKFDRDLRYLLSIGRPGRDDFELDEPRGIGLYRRFGQIFVSEREGAQYFWIGTDVFTPSMSELHAGADGSWSGVARYFLTEYSTVSLGLVGDDGRTMVPLQGPSWTAPGPVSRPVSFRVPDGAGPLRLQVVAVPTYSSRKILKVEKRTPPLPLAAHPAGSR